MFFAHSALAGEFDNMICVLKLVTNLVKGDKFGLKVKGLTEGRREKACGEEFATFISVDNARDLVTMGALVQFQEVHEVLLPTVSEKHKGEEVPTLRPEAKGTQQLFVDTEWGPL